MYQLLDGKKTAEELREKVRQEVLGFEKKPGLAVILVGKEPASEIYVNLKVKKCEEAGIKSYKYELEEKTSEKELLELINKLNKDKKINGILVQLPLPEHISRNVIVSAVAPEKDVDGFGSMNIGKLILKDPCLKPCTPRGIIKLLKSYNIELKGKNAVIIGRSIIVGNPVSQMLLNEEATVTICHSKTKNLKEHTLNADIIVSAVGKRKLVTADMVKEGAVVVDVGTVREENKLYGDVDFENVKEKCSYITPVPGGVGPMTIACLLENTLTAYKMQNKLVSR